MDSRSVPAEGADWTAGRGAGGGFNSPACMFMSNVLSPMGGIDHRCHIWQWLTAPVIAMLALGEEQTTMVGPWKHGSISQSPTSPARDITSRYTMCSRGRPELPRVWWAAWLMDVISVIYGVMVSWKRKREKRKHLLWFPAVVQAQTSRNWWSPFSPTLFSSLSDARVHLSAWRTASRLARNVKNKRTRDRDGNKRRGDADNWCCSEQQHGH